MVIACAGSKGGQYENRILFCLFHSNIYTLNLYSVPGSGLKNNLYNVLVFVPTLGCFIIMIKSPPAIKMSLRMSN